MDRCENLGTNTNNREAHRGNREVTEHENAMQTTTSTSKGKKKRIYKHQYR